MSRALAQRPRRPYAGRKGRGRVQQEAERAAIEVARVAPGFPRTPEGCRDRQVREITAGLDPAAVMIALGALLRRGIDRALDEGREDKMARTRVDGTE